MYEGKKKFYNPFLFYEDSLCIKTSNEFLHNA